MHADLALPEAGNLVDALQGRAVHALVILAHVLTQLTSGEVHVIIRGMVDELCGGREGITAPCFEVLNGSTTGHITSDRKQHRAPDLFGTDGMKRPTLSQRI